jgi:hypothetical protein
MLTLGTAIASLRASQLQCSHDHQVVYICTTLLCHRLTITYVGESKIILTNSFMTFMLL